MTHFSRRQFLLCSTAGTTAFGLGLGLVGSMALAPIPALAAPGKAETTEVDLGFIALTDAAPLIIAKEKGFFAKEGMTGVNLKKQTSWAVTRDNLELGGGRGGIDGAHLLTPMAYLLTTGAIAKSRQPVPISILARLNTQGQGLSASKAFLPAKFKVKSANLESVIDKKNKTGDKFKAAVTFPGGTHDLWMRYWLAANGVDPNKDVDIVVIPPPQMVANMQSNTMDVFCVGEPWNERLVNKKLGYTVLQTGEIWKQHPEKAFSMRSDWVKKNPNASLRLLMAVQQAQKWADNPANTKELATILAQDKYVKASVDDLLPRLQGTVDYGDGRKVTNSPYKMLFFQSNASFPYKSHDTWFVTENIRWGYLPKTTNIKALVAKVNRSDLWRKAAKENGYKEIPSGDSRGVEVFFDGVKFDANNPQAYLKALKFKALQ
ncbi:ABC transporter substrate-binding protein [Synechococcus sp. Tobar12-5m-g]|uniref:CmpA/NrtA family ABC transporter substrate-binding protein n=1 Tax=unclassified Synechococcus TaxID=2626047 RepID=UPI0020CBCA8C|nr:MULTISPECIES: CmpA/NrtA family ABC transporter substrate-binding protein [unclassified Synechococcus]MCP9772026.1 ABC transporter substrate-binding protein [Synechococcus sp. Tobar12-5m-g]MCP9872968.1 ABC transporter substrate-binding protein [Synechococcus sp. Cruz CV-v-12]